MGLIPILARRSCSGSYFITKLRGVPLTMKANLRWQSTIGKKIVMGVSGLVLAAFLVMHLAGNLALFIPDGGRSFNLYSKTLHQLGPILNVVRIGLAAFFLYHIVT